MNKRVVFDCYTVVYVPMMNPDEVSGGVSDSANGRCPGTPGM